MKIIITTVILLTFIFTAKAFSDRRLIGTWVKTKVSEEDHTYSKDKIWNLEVTFKTNGTFNWKSLYNTTSNIIDCSLSGKYKIKGNCVVSFYFDKTADKNKKQERYLFSFWPNQNRGEFVFFFKQNELVLSGGRKWHVYFKKKR